MVSAQLTARRRVYHFTQRARDIEPWETERWFHVLEWLLGSGLKVADQLGITSTTYYRWCADDHKGAPRHWTYRVIYMAIFNEIVTSMSRRQEDTGKIPIKFYPDLAKKVALCRQIVEECLSGSGMWMHMEVSDEPMPHRQRCILWLADYLKPGKRYLHTDILADGLEEGFSRQTIFRAAEYLHVIRERKKEMMTKGMKATIHWRLDAAPDIAELDQSLLDTE